MTSTSLNDQERKELLTINPVKSEEAKRLYKLLWEVYTEVFAKAYFITSDFIKIYTDSESKPFSLQHLPTAIIIAHLINKSTTLLEGPPGSGKTMLVRIMSRLMTGSSMEKSNNIINCDEDLDKDKWMGTPNIAKLLGTDKEEKKIEGEEVEEVEEKRLEILWADWMDDDVDFIVDEVNRANPQTQNEFLLIMSEGKVQYDVKNGKKIKNVRMFMTQNPLDESMMSEGVYPLGYAFKDRITQSIKVPQAPRMGMKMFSNIRKDDRNLDYDEDMEIKPILTTKDIQKATILASRIPVTPKADDYANYLVRDMSLCLRSQYFDKTHSSKDNLAGQGLCNGCHFMGVKVNYHCEKFYGGSMRIYKDLIAVARAYAFFLGLEEVNEYLMQSISMDVISHRVIVLKNMLRKDNKYGKWKDSFIKQYLVDWSFQNLMKREDAERAYKNLYEGRGTEKDVERIWNDAQNDIYVRIELLPNVIAIPEELLSSNLMEIKRSFPSVTDPMYKEIASSIVNVRNDFGMKAKDKFNKLNTLLSKVTDTNLRFSNNLFSMIYMMFPVLIKEMKEQQNK